MSSAPLAPSLTPQVLCIAAQPAEIVGEMLLSSTVAVNGLMQGLELLRCRDLDVVLASLPVAGCGEAAGLLEELQRAQPGTPVIIHAPGASSTQVVRLLRLGAFHVYTQGDATSLLFLAANSKWDQEARSSVIA